MGDTLDQAREAMDGARERNARYVAIVISVLAAALALAEMQEKAALTEYMTRNIEVSDDYAFYQAKTLRAASKTGTADVLDSLPNATDPAMAKRAADARAEAARLLDDDKTRGAKQLRAQAEGHTAQREELHHRYELFELVVGALQIAIVLASVSVVTRVRTLAWVAGAIGVGAIAAGVMVFAGVL